MYKAVITGTTASNRMEVRAAWKIANEIPAAVNISIRGVKTSSILPLSSGLLEILQMHL